MRSLLDHKRWVLKSPPPDRAASGELAEGLSSVMATLLAVRGDGEGDPRRLLRQGLDQLYPPELLCGTEQAAERLIRALREGEAVFIHGDFDVDGITSTAMLYLALRGLGLSAVKVEIEDRQRGHGLNAAVVRRVLREGFSLVITVDCGVSDTEHVQALRRGGVDVIVTDHHHPPKDLPPATALINPRLPNCPYPNKALAGVGVAFQLLRALYARLGEPPEAAHRFLDLVMLGTVADLVPLVHGGEVENKILVVEGLRCLARGEGNLGLRTLLSSLRLDPERLSAGEVGFIVAPKVNAANRVGDPRAALLLFTTQDPARARYLAETLIDYNEDRQIAQSDLRALVEEAIRRGDVDLDRERLIFLEGRYWNPGILGLVASDIAERYWRPTILVSRGDHLSRASGRSIPPFNLIRALEGVAPQAHFTRYGGHAMAAGFTVPNERLPAVKEALLACARRALADLDVDGPVHTIDCALRPEQIHLELYEELQRLAPFGMGNPAPRFLLGRARVTAAQTVGEGRHLKFLAQADGRVFEAIGFDMGRHLEAVCRAGEVGLVFKLGRNDWLGQSRVQLDLADVLQPVDL